MLRVLFPRVKRKRWRRHDAGAKASDAQFEAVRKKILTRDGYRCAYCGFSAQMQDVNHIDDSQANNDPKNLETACPLCHSYFSLGLVGLSGHARLARVPELSRTDVNHLLRTIFVALEMGSDEEKAEAQALYVALADRVKQVSQAYGTADAALFGEVLLRMDEERYAAVTSGDAIEDVVYDEAMRRQVVKRDGALAHLVLLFHPKRVARYMPAWLKAYAALPMSTWKDIYGRERGHQAEQQAGA